MGDTIEGLLEIQRQNARRDAGGIGMGDDVCDTGYSVQDGIARDTAELVIL
jgi:hypothetical protein